MQKGSGFCLTCQSKWTEDRRKWVQSTTKNFPGIAAAELFIAHTPFPLDQKTKANTEQFKWLLKISLFWH